MSARAVWTVDDKKTTSQKAPSIPHPLQPMKKVQGAFYDRNKSSSTRSSAQHQKQEEEWAHSVKQHVRLLIPKETTGSLNTVGACTYDTAVLHYRARKMNVLQDWEGNRTSQAEPVAANGTA